MTTLFVILLSSSNQIEMMPVHHYETMQECMMHKKQLEYTAFPPTGYKMISFLCKLEA